MNPNSQTEVLTTLSTSTDLGNITDAIYALAQPTYFDWLTLFASFVSVVVSGLAIYFAILIPKNLANQKNRISMFEKRYDMYLLLLDLHGIFKDIEQSPTRTEDTTVIEALDLLKRQQGSTDTSQFFNLMVTALDSPRYFFSFDTNDPQYTKFYHGVKKALLLQRGAGGEDCRGDLEEIYNNLDFFYNVVKEFERYFYICPPKNKK